MASRDADRSSEPDALGGKTPDVGQLLAFEGELVELLQQAGTSINVESVQGRWVIRELDAVLDLEMVLSRRFDEEPGHYLTYYRTIDPDYEDQHWNQVRSHYATLLHKNHDDEGRYRSGITEFAATAPAIRALRNTALLNLFTLTNAVTVHVSGKTVVDWMEGALAGAVDLESIRPENRFTNVLLREPIQVPNELLHWSHRPRSGVGQTWLSGAMFFQTNSGALSGDVRAGLFRSDVLEKRNDFLTSIALHGNPLGPQLAAMALAATREHLSTASEKHVPSFDGMSPAVEVYRSGLVSRGRRRLNRTDRLTRRSRGSSVIAPLQIPFGPSTLEMAKVEFDPTLPGPVRPEVGYGTSSPTESTAVVEVEETHRTNTIQFNGQTLWLDPGSHKRDSGLSD